MASKTQKTEGIRKRKDRPSKANMKVDQRRVEKNLEILNEALRSK